MAPNSKESATIAEEEWEVEQPVEDDYSKERPPTVVVWRNVYAFLVLHVAAIFGLYLAFTSATYKTLFFCLLPTLPVRSRSDCRGTQTVGP